MSPIYVAKTIYFTHKCIPLEMRTRKGWQELRNNLWSFQIGLFCIDSIPEWASNHVFSTKNKLRCKLNNEITMVYDFHSIKVRLLDIRKCNCSNKTTNTSLVWKKSRNGKVTKNGMVHNMNRLLKRTNKDIPEDNFNCSTHLIRF